MKSVRISRRSFFKAGAGLLVSLLGPSGGGSLFAGVKPSPIFGREIPSRCPLCAMGCGVIYLKRTDGRWSVEGDPDCPVAGGSLCARGTSLLAVSDLAASAKPLVRNPGSSQWEELPWSEAVDRVARRIKDFRDRELRGVGNDSPHSNRFEGMGIISGGHIANEEAYLAAKLFRSLGIVQMDTTVRAGRGMAVLGLLEVLGLPGPTHPPVQVADSDVVFLVGCNPGQTSPVLSRALDNVRRRHGVVIVLDPRMTESVKEGDIWLNVRPGCDAAVLGGLLHWVLENVSPRKEELTQNTDAAFMTLTETLGQYERHTGKRAEEGFVTDPSLEEPYSIFQRLKRHYERYDLRKVSDIAGVDETLLRRAARLLARTGEQEFSACFVLGAGALGRPSGPDSARMAAMIQALLGNLKKRGGGIVIAAGAGNAQGVCDMGLLSPFLPGYLALPRHGEGVGGEPHVSKDMGALHALLRAWFDGTGPSETVGYLPVLDEGETPLINTILQGIGEEKVRSLVLIGADPVMSIPGSGEIRENLSNLDLLVVLDVLPSKTCEFWMSASVDLSSVKTEVIYLPIQAPAQRGGTMTDGGRRVRPLYPVEGGSGAARSLLGILVELGVHLKEAYRREGGSVDAPVMALRWPLKSDYRQIAEEINGVLFRNDDRELLSPEHPWEGEVLCGNRLYRGWLSEAGWQVERRGVSDRNRIGLFEEWGWFWPGGIPDPFSWIFDRTHEATVLLRWEGQEGMVRSGDVALPLRRNLPVKFWRESPHGIPFPEHYEPLHSPLPDLLTGGKGSPDIVTRFSGGEPWDYLSRRPEMTLEDYQVIMTVHRTGNMAGSGGVVAQVDWLRELGTARVLEIGVDLAARLKVVSGDTVTVRSPHFRVGVTAAVLVTRRIGNYQFNGRSFALASLSLYGEGTPSTNDLPPPAFSSSGEGMQIKAFMAKVEKA